MKTNARHVPFIVLIMAVAALAVSNARLRAELRRATSADPAAQNQNAAEAGSEAGRKLKAAIDAVAERAVAEAGKSPLVPMSAQCRRNYDGESVLVSFGTDGEEVFQPEGEKQPVMISPPVKDLSWHWSDWEEKLSLGGSFRPETTYTITFAKGWRDAGGRVMEKPSSVTFRTGRMKPAFTFALSEGKYWPARRDALRLPFSSQAATNIAVNIRRAYESNIPLFGLELYEQSPKSMTLVSTNVPVRIRGEIWEWQSGLLDIGSLLPDARPGIYIVNALAADGGETFYSWEGVHHFVFALTDLAISFDGNPDAGGGASATVLSFATGEPVPDAEISLYSRKHQKICSSRTDANGIALFDPVLEDCDDSIQFAVATKGDDISVLEIDSDSSMANVQSSLVGLISKPRVFVFSERELCRPGEKFTSLAFLRSPLKDGAKALAGAPVEFRLVDPDGKSVAKSQSVADEYGFASVEWTIPGSAALGNWRVECLTGAEKAGSLSMRVSNYTPDRVKVKITPDGLKDIGLAVPLEIKGSARYYFDEPLASGSCKFTASMSPAELPRHFRGWHAGAPCDMPRKAWSEYADINEDGTFGAFYPGLASNGLEHAYAPVALDVFATVQEPSGPSVSAHVRNVFHPTAEYIGIRELKGRESAYEVALLPAIAGAEVTNAQPRSIEVSLEREVWSRRLVKTGNGTVKAEWHSVMVAMSNLTVRMEVPAGNVSDWRGELGYNPAELPNGHYVLTAADGLGLKTSFGFWHWAGEAGERSTSPSSIRFETGAESYAPGELADVSFISPFNGNAFVAAGVSCVDEASRICVTQGLNRVSVRIPPSLLASRYYVAVTLVSADGAEARRLFGMAKIPVDTSASRKLLVSLKMPDVALPGEKCGMTVTLAGANGEPCGGRVSIVAIDEGVAALTNYHVEDPYAYFFARDLGTPFSVYDCFNAVFPELKIMPDGTFGGDGIEEGGMARMNMDSSLLKEKETVRLVVPEVNIGTNGTADIEVDIPDHSGALRFFAVAADELRSGGCEDSMVVRSPLGIAAGAPRFAAGGDEFALSATLFRHDGTNGTLKFEAVLPEGIRTLAGEDRVEETVELVGRNSAVVSCRLVADSGAQGPRDISMTLSHGGRQAKGTVTVNLRAPRPVSSASEFVVMTNGTHSFRCDSGDWIGKASARLTLSATPATALATSLDWLGEYPYGCLEQTISRAFPYVAAGDLESLGIIDHDKFEASKAMVALAAAEILQMRADNGYFCMWPWEAKTWDYGTLLANHFIFEAVRAGIFPIDPSLREAQIRTLRQFAQSQSPKDRRNAAYACYILAVAGEVEFINPARNIVAAGKVDYPAFLASAAMIRGGFASEGVAMFEKAIDARVWEDESPWYGVMDCGMALFVAAKTGYGDIARLAPAAARLNSKIRNDGTGWGNTRDNGWATLGLAAYAARLGPAKATGKIRIGDVTKPFDVSDKAAVFDIPADCDVSVAVDGAAFAQLRTVGVPSKPPACSGKIAISRRYVDGEGRDVKSVRRGELVGVVIEVESPAAIDNAVMADMLPGGFELEDRTFATRTIAGSYSIPDGIPELDGEQELRNDRWIWVGSIPKGNVGGKRHQVMYHMRAVVPGDYAVPALTVEDMYDPDMSGCHEAGDGARIAIEE